MRRIATRGSKKFSCQPSKAGDTRKRPSGQGRVLRPWQDITKVVAKKLTGRGFACTIS